jgi:Tol biopolymer transport system component
MSVAARGTPSRRVVTSRLAMRLPIIPAIVSITLLSAVWYLFNATHSGVRTLDVPHLTRLADIEGIETEVAIAPDGSHYAVIASGNLWFLNTSTGEHKQLTHTPEPASFPAWSPDGKRIAFTRASNTFAINVDSLQEETIHPDAAYWSWSSNNRVAFVRDRALWTAGPGAQGEKKLVDGDATPDVSIRSPKFSPDGSQIAFIKTQLGLRGEVWIVDVSNGMARALVADRVAENPLDVAWTNEGRYLAYLTNRAASYSLWYVDFAQSTINPLTQSLVTVPLARIGIAAYKDRIVVPRHFVDSNIVLSDGTAVAASEKLEYQPAASPDGNLIAYTIAEENKSEIWTAGLHSEKPIFRAIGREPRFSANGFQIVYTHTDLTGNDDIWKIDIRNGSAERVTDADEIDVAADWSPDGQSIAFASARGGALSIWTTPASGGKRLRINDGGYAPRYSPDSKSISFWNRNAIWTMQAAGKNPREVVRDVFEPAAGVWTRQKDAHLLVKPPVDYPVWPGFDIMPDGRFVLAPIDVRETALWAVDLTFKEK